MLKKLFRGLFLGGIAGFIGGLLFAPQKGEKTREQLKKNLDKARSEGETIVNKIKNSFEDMKKSEE